MTNAETTDRPPSKQMKIGLFIGILLGTGMGIIVGRLVRAQEVNLEFVLASVAGAALGAGIIVLALRSR